jgi:hypothetical protein
MHLVLYLRVLIRSSFGGVRAQINIYIGTESQLMANKKILVFANQVPVVNMPVTHSGMHAHTYTCPRAHTHMRARACTGTHTHSVRHCTVVADSN